MRKLTRPPAPAELGNFSHPPHTWDDGTAALNRAIWEALEQMQRPTPSSEVLCAYCERPISKRSADGKEHRHVEHFWRRSSWPKKTFAWDNLFGSCTAEKRTCGHFKEHASRPYEPSVLLDPCVDDPSRFLNFDLRGEVFPRAGLSKDDARRAQETIRVFNLNEPGLTSQRAAVLRPLCEAFDAFSKDYTDDQIDELLTDEAARLAHLPFTAARRRWA